MSSVSKFGDLKGRIFNRLTVLDRVQKTRGGHIQWICRCSCGNIVVVTGSNLVNEKVKSCGCLQREKRKENIKNLGRGWDAVCKYCGTEFRVKSHAQKYCSEECSFLDRLHRNIDTGCLEWTGPVNAQGYGLLFSKLENKIVSTHRYSWERVHGKIPKGLCVCHKCDNPKCVNVEHLFLGSKYDNNHDRALKDRSGKRVFTEEDRVKYSFMNRGEKNNSAKLTEEQVLLIKKLRGVYTKKELSEKFGVSVACIKRHIRRKDMDIPRGQYFKNILISIDQLVNSLLGGYCDESISSRAYRWEKDGKRSWTRKLIDVIFFWEERHCYASFISEREGRQLPPELR